MNFCLTVLTCVPDNAPKMRRRLPHLMKTLQLSDFPGEVVIVDDGSKDPKHSEHLNAFEQKGVRVVRRPKRGGISRAKNTCLRVLRDSEFDFGFIMEDDVEVSPNWWQPYVNAHKKTGIHHFSWAADRHFSNMHKRVRTVRKGQVVQCSRLNGVLLTVTPRQIAKIGGFKVLPRKWGFEHINYTDRCVRNGFAPFYADILGSEKFVRLGPGSRFTFISHKDRQASNRANRPGAMSRQVREPLKE